MREVAIGDGRPLKLNQAQRAHLGFWLQDVHRRAQSNRYPIENIWRTALSMYQGTPPERPGWTPFENAPCIEVTIAASAADSILSQAEDLLFQIQPPVMSRAKQKQWDMTAEALGDLIDWGTAPGGPWRFEPGVKEGLIDSIQLGTQVYYVPYTKTVRVTDVRKVESFGPKIYALDPNDFLIPENASKDIQACKWATMRMPMTKGQLNLKARMNNWTVDDAAASDHNSVVRNARLRAAGILDSDPDKNTIHIADTFAYFDVYDDGVERDIEVIWNMTSGGILKVMYNRYDCRPFVLECYQDRAHMAYGLGVMEMMTPYERELSEIHNLHIWNMMVCDMKMYQGPSTALQEADEIYPGKWFPRDTPNDKIEAIEMGNANPAAFQAEAVVSSMARERSGVQSLTAPVRSSSRTPGISMLSMMQQANRRFTHPFANMRNGAAAAVVQCVYRIQERVRKGDQKVMRKLGSILGDDKAQLLINLFKSTEYELSDCVEVQMKAASVSVNRESDRQNMVMLATQIFPLYKQGMAEAAQLIVQPPFPGADNLGRQMGDILNRLMHKILKTFDQVADVRSLQVDLDELQPVAQQTGLEQIPGQMQGVMNHFAQVTGQNGAGPAPQGPLQ